MYNELGDAFSRDMSRWYANHAYNACYAFISDPQQQLPICSAKQQQTHGCNSMAAISTHMTVAINAKLW